MPLQPGEKLGPYEVIAPIGKGGMGEVYKARDTRLDRMVALKVSAAQFSERFEREAKAIAALNHPSICTLHDVGPNYLVMEYIEGAPLKGPLPVDQALKYGVQICQALEAAHKKGITHRDLKPANILATKSGIKLLDFGLAKLSSGSQDSAPPDDATLTMALTGKNEIVGTLYYMSPEQLQAQGTGREIDARSDIFSFGIVLYELLSGKRAFEGSSAASVIAAIMERPAPSVAEIGPPALDRVLQKCLAKDPENRWQTVRDLKDELEWIASTPESGSAVAAAPPKKPPLRWWWPAAAGVLLLIAAGLASYILFHSKPAVPAETLRFQIPASEKSSFNIYLSLSPDGRMLAYVADGADGQSRLWIRKMDSLEARSLAGTEGALSPFWSPDSRSLAFGVGDKLKRIDVSGGPVQTVCELQAQVGVGFWGPDGIILVGNRGTGPGLSRVSAVGGTASLVTSVDASRQERAHGFPVLLPENKHFLYTRLSSTEANGGIFLGSLDSKPDAQGSTRILPAQSSSAYVPPAAGTGPGYLLFLQDRILMAQPFDARKFELRGEPVPLAEQIGTLGSYGFFSASASGALAYRVGGVDANNRQLTWYDHQGKAVGIVGPPVDIQAPPAISSDGGSIAIARLDRQEGVVDVWVHDVSRNTDSRLTYGPLHGNAPVWSPDGVKIAYSSRDGPFNLFEKNSSGVGQEDALDKDERSKTVRDWSRDGRYIVEEVGRGKTGLAVWVLPLFGDRKAFPYLEAEFDEDLPKLSPNGQWLAYRSNETKRNEIYVQSFPKPGGKWQISTDGGTSPVWSRDGKEIYFLGANRKMMEVDVKGGAGSNFDSGSAKTLFDFPNAAATFDVSKDGRFLIPAAVEQTSGAPITVVVNWAAGLRRN